jgi:hypothetical protein
MIRYACVLALAAQSAMAAAPVIVELRPRGAELGRPLLLTAIGRRGTCFSLSPCGSPAFADQALPLIDFRNIGEGARAISTPPASFTTQGGLR